MPLPFRKKKKKKKKKLPDPPSFYKQREKAMQGPPRMPPPLPTPKQQVHEGPPRQQPEQGIAGPPNLPPPPPFTENTPTQPSRSSQQSAKAPVPIFDDNLANEIHAELRQREFGSTMKKAPEKQVAPVSTEDLAKRHFLNAKQEKIYRNN